MASKVWESVLMLITAGLFTFISSFAIAYFFNNNSVVTIGDSTKISNDQYISIVNVSAFKDIKKLRIDVPYIIDDEGQIKSNTPLNISSVKNNIGTINGTVFEIEKIPSDTNVELIIFTENPLNDEKILIDENENMIDVVYSNEVRNPIQKQLKTIIANAIVYALLIGGFSVWDNRKREQRLTYYKEEKQDIQERSDRLLKDLEASKKETEIIREKTEKNIENFEKIKNEGTKRNILLLAKLNDYRKELNFWRDTIRKVIYQLPNGEEKAEKLINIVTSSLRTYQTNEKNSPDFETLKVLSKIINDNDEDR